MRVKLFAILRERAGTSETNLELPSDTKVSDAIDAIGRQFPAVRDGLGRAAFAVNQEYANLATILRDSDELALIPPVSGG